MATPPRPPIEASMHLFHRDSEGTVFGRTWTNHVIEVSDQEADDLLRNTLWRRATDDDLPDPEPHTRKRAKS